MNLLSLLIVGFIALAIGSVLGYYARQSIAKKRKGTIEAKLQKRIDQTKEEVEKMISQAQKEVEEIKARSYGEIDRRREELLRTQSIVLKRESILEKKINDFEGKEREFEGKIQKLRELKEKLENLRVEAEKELENIAGLSKEEAEARLLEKIEKDYEKDVLERIRKLEREGTEKFENKAKEIIIDAIQGFALSQAQEATTTTISLPSDEVKGRIIGKEGRNIKAFEKLTGVEVLVDETPESVVISGFHPIRRHIAKVALERLIKDGRIQPAKIEEQVKKAKEEVEKQIRDFGEKAVYEVGILDLPEKLVYLLGRLYFRLSYGQNVLLHSIEVAFLSAKIAEEIGVNVKIAKKAGLLHDIGKSVDHEVEGSHVDIGVKILESLKIEKEVVEAMKAHHEDYEATTPEAVIIRAADAISGARPGARKDTLENYLKRLKELEDIAASFKGVAEAYAIQAGRELRVFVKPEELGDLEAHKLARDIAAKIQQELNYPGEIKVSVIRETRVVEYAK